jgi:hypothetical protein
LNIAEDLGRVKHKSRTQDTGTDPLRRDRWEPLAHVLDLNGYAIGRAFSCPPTLARQTSAPAERGSLAMAGAGTEYGSARDKAETISVSMRLPHSLAIQDLRNRVPGHLQSKVDLSCRSGIRLVTSRIDSTVDVRLERTSPPGDCPGDAIASG